ncbi:MAG TPA: transposase [candidate division Zixibacteria bacterium]|nr:transposase [candidate division Zixibacteria bacterium]
MTKTESRKPTAESTIRNIRHNSRRKHSGEEKIDIVLEGLRSEEMVTELCRREGIGESFYYRWSKEFLEAAKQRLVGKGKIWTDSRDVNGLRWEDEHFKPERMQVIRLVEDSVLASACMS